MDNVTYLGDGVYARFDGWHIWLEVERDGRRHMIALEPPVYEALKAFAYTHGVDR